MRIMRRKGNTMKTVETLDDLRAEFLKASDCLWQMRDLMRCKFGFDGKSLEVEYLDKALGALGTCAYAVLCTMHERQN